MDCSCWKKRAAGDTSKPGSREVGDSDVDDEDDLAADRCGGEKGRQMTEVTQGDSDQQSTEESQDDKVSNMWSQPSITNLHPRMSGYTRPL